jgi:hypothetical protein
MNAECKNSTMSQVNHHHADNGRLDHCEASRTVTDIYVKGYLTLVLVYQ